MLSKKNTGHVKVGGGCISFTTNHFWVTWGDKAEKVKVFFSQSYKYWLQQGKTICINNSNTG